MAYFELEPESSICLEVDTSVYPFSYRSEPAFESIDDDSYMYMVETAHRDWLFVPQGGGGLQLYSRKQRDHQFLNEGNIQPRNIDGVRKFLRIIASIDYGIMDMVTVDGQELRISEILCDKPFMNILNLRVGAAEPLKINGEAVWVWCPLMTEYPSRSFDAAFDEYIGTSGM